MVTSVQLNKKIKLLNCQPPVPRIHINFSSCPQPSQKPGFSLLCFKNCSGALELLITMASAEQVLVNNTASSLIEQLGKELVELEAHKNASDDKVQWKEIKDHFYNLETMLKKKSEELEAKEKEYEEKESKTHALLAEREVAVAAKEQDFIDRVQELKDAAVAAIADARANYQPAYLDSFDGGDNQDSKVSSSLGDRESPEEEFPHEMGKNDKGVDVKPRPELTQFCEQMDVKGLLNFIMENKKIVYAIREELSVALESAVEPARLVLDLLEGFYPPNETNKPLDERDAAPQGMRKSCIMIIEAMAALLARIDPGAVHLLNPETKQQAKAIADEWKPKLASAGMDPANANSLEAQAFLQLLATFRIASEFDEEELCMLILVVPRYRQAPELCRSLGLSHKVPGLIETLVNSGKQIDAVHFIHAFQHTESFPPVPLLKTYLKDLRRNSQGKGGNSSGASGAQNDVNAQELAALKAVIGCVEEYKLEADYPLDPLQKRVAQLEKSKSDRKRGGDTGKHQKSKKHRAIGGYRGFRAPGGNVAASRKLPSVFANRDAYGGMPVRYPQVSPNPTDYQVPAQSAYAQQINDQRLYYYPQDDRAAPSSHNSAPVNYDGYMGSGLQPSHQPYM